MHVKVAALGETIRQLPLTHSTEATESDPNRSTVNQKPPLLAEDEIRTRLAAWRGLVSPDLPRYRVQRTIRGDEQPLPPRRPHLSGACRPSRRAVSQAKPEEAP